MKVFKKVLIALSLLFVIMIGYGIWILYGSNTSNPNNYKTIGDIPTPWGINE